MEDHSTSQVPHSAAASQSAPLGPESAPNTASNSSSESTPDAASPAPVSSRERITSLDVLRGFALMGVLLMNMQAFAMPFCAYMNPTSFGNDDPLNFPLWSINHVVADAKFITIFSMLFGAGIVLMTTRAKERTGRSLSLHYRRMFWLAVFGCLHGILLWYGDILLIYAICGALAYWFRNRSILFLGIASVILMAIPAALAANFDSFKASMTSKQQEEMHQMWSPSEEEIAERVTAYRSGYLDHLPKRYESWKEMFSFLIFFGWRVLGVMLLGMALFKGGVLSARKSNSFYETLVIVGFGVGIPLAAYGIYYNELHDWTVEQAFGFGSLFNYVGSLSSAFAWIGVVMLVHRKSIAESLQRRFAAVGQMAFTNYIMHSVICTTFFYGHGLGYFGHVGRLGQLMLVIAIGALQLWYSPVWLKRFRFGPLEWLWRSLAYWRRYEMARA